MLKNKLPYLMPSIHLVTIFGLILINSNLVQAGDNQYDRSSINSNSNSRRSSNSSVSSSEETTEDFKSKLENHLKKNSNGKQKIKNLGKTYDYSDKDYKERAEEIRIQAENNKLKQQIKLKESQLSPKEIDLQNLRKTLNSARINSETAFNDIDKQYDSEDPKREDAIILQKKFTDYLEKNEKDQKSRLEEKNRLETIRSQMEKYLASFEHSKEEKKFLGIKKKIDKNQVFKYKLYPLFKSSGELSKLQNSSYGTSVKDSFEGTQEQLEAEKAKAFSEIDRDLSLAQEQLHKSSEPSISEFYKTYPDAAEEDQSVRGLRDYEYLKRALNLREKTSSTKEGRDLDKEISCIEDRMRLRGDESKIAKARNRKEREPSRNAVADNGNKNRAQNLPNETEPENNFTYNHEEYLRNIRGEVESSKRNQKTTSSGSANMNSPVHKDTILTSQRELQMSKLNLRKTPAQSVEADTKILQRFENDLSSNNHDIKNTAIVDMSHLHGPNYTLVGQVFEKAMLSSNKEARDAAEALLADYPEPGHKVIKEYLLKSPHKEVTEITRKATSYPEMIFWIKELPKYINDTNSPAICNDCTGHVAGHRK